MPNLGRSLLTIAMTTASLAGSGQISGADRSRMQLHNNATVSQVWSPDLGKGTYKNPVLNADYSDPDAIRVGDQFYLVASSFDSVPGLPILESYDLVNWRLIGHALDRQPPFERYSETQHGNGVWAPALRFHDGEFYLFYPDPDIGIYMMKAKNAAGPWSQPVLIKAAKGWIDPCPLWDEEGKAYLISGLAASRAGAKSALIVSRMKPDGTKLLDGGAIVYDGHGEDTTIEGPKLYKRRGYYYIFAPAGGVPTGWQLVLRSRNIFGPYERRKVLEQGTTEINGPHQGAWVDTGTGEDWFLHFQDRGWLGRVVHLEPMKWIDDWPEIGDMSHGQIGQPVLTYKKPRTLHASVLQNPADSDEFNGATLGLQWQWQANPEPTWGFPSQALGALRLIATPAPTSTRNLWDTPAVLLQKLPASRFVATTKLTAALRNEGDRAGLVLMGKDYGSLVIAKTSQGTVIRQLLCLRADQGSPGRVAAEVHVPQNEIYLRVSVDEGKALFSYSLDGKEFHAIGQSFMAQPGVWIGAKVGIFASGETDRGEFGYADFDWLRFTPLT
jgi:beta-xylosidase